MRILVLSCAILAAPLPALAQGFSGNITGDFQSQFGPSQQTASNPNNGTLPFIAGLTIGDQTREFFGPNIGLGPTAPFSAGGDQTRNNATFSVGGDTTRYSLPQ